MIVFIMHESSFYSPITNLSSTICILQMSANICTLYASDWPAFGFAMYRELWAEKGIYFFFMNRRIKLDIFLNALFS
jgi:hypothetical protein